MTIKRHQRTVIELERTAPDGFEQKHLDLHEALRSKGLRIGHRDGRMVAVTIAGRESVGPTFDADDFEGMHAALLAGEIDRGPA